MDSHQARELNVGDVLEYVAPGLWKGRTLLRWPPDAFAAMAVLLQRSGAYMQVLETWPPSLGKQWLGKITEYAQDWGNLATSDYLRMAAELAAHGSKTQKSSFEELENGKWSAPWYQQLVKWWSTVLKWQEKPLSVAASNPKFYRAALQICSMADEACRGIGQPGSREHPQTEMGAAFQTLVASGTQRNATSATACLAVPPSRVIVLPKLHTPQTGMTLRALTHHIGLCPGTEVKTGWVLTGLPGTDHSLNILLLPWPEQIHPAQFQACKTEELGLQLPSAFGHFSYKPKHPTWNVARLRAVIAAALERAGDIDGIILPELTFSSMRDYLKFVQVVFRELVMLAEAAGK